MPGLASLPTFFILHLIILNLAQLMLMGYFRTLFFSTAGPSDPNAVFKFRVLDS